MKEDKQKKIAKQTALENFMNLQTVIELNGGDIAGVIAINIDEKTRIFSGGDDSVVLDIFSKTAYSLTKRLAKEIPIDEAFELIIELTVMAAESAREELEEENKQ